MLYFAYGSNMDFKQMRQRCPSAQFVAVAKLPNHRLEFTRESKKWQCGVSDVVESSREDVWGVVYDITETEFASLDQDEGFRPGRAKSENSYNREQRHVFRDGDENQAILVWIYIGNHQSDPPLPNTAYKQQLVNGAKYWHLPPTYIAKLKKIKTSK